MSKFDAKITTKRSGDKFEVAWDVNRDGKNFMNGLNTFHAIKDAGAQFVFDTYKNTLGGLPFAAKVAGTGLNATIKYDDVTEAQFLAVEAACNSVLVQLNSHAIAAIK